MKHDTAKKKLLLAAEILFCVVIVLNLLTILLSLTDLRDHFGWMPFAAISAADDSMAPHIKRGDLVLLFEAPYDSLEVGDDLTFATTAGLATRRIIGVRGGEYVTCTIANENADYNTVGEEEYCGKAVLAIPFVGYTLDALQSPIMLVCLCVLAVLVVFLPSYFSRAHTQTDKQTTNRERLRRRLLVCLCAVSLILCLPHLTEAKYIAKINRLDIAWAKPLYFSSNYLSEGEGNTYSIQGWNGKPYALSLQIKNHTNTLLYNESETPITYGFGYKIHTDEEHNVTGAYTIAITPSEEITALEQDVFTFPTEWTENGIVTDKAYRIEGGRKLTQQFSVTITPTETLANPQKIRFEIFAVTNQDESYFMQLGAEFSLSVAESADFLNNIVIHNLSTMVTVSVTTNLISDDDSEKIVLFEWDPNELYINEFESTAFNVITNYPDSYYSRQHGRIYMRLQAFSKINLEFFKKDNDIEVDNDTVRVSVVDEVPDALPDPDVTS